MDFEYKREMNYYETDRMGIIHHSNYIRFLEECRCAWMKSLNMPMEKLEEDGITIPTIEVDCKYKYHVTSGDTIIIKPIVTEFNGIRMTVTYEVIEEKTGKTVIEAYTKHCFTNDKLKPINLKKYNEEYYNIFKSLHQKQLTNK